MGSHRETLSMSNILCNALFSVLVLAAVMVTAVGLFTYQWVETTDEKMEEANIQIPANAPGLKTVSCGLITYCIDAAGRVSECSLPWPRYGDSVLEQPSNYWLASAVLLLIAIVQLTLAWLYSLVACFGCFSTRLYTCCLSSVSFAALWMLCSLLVWGASFTEFAVNEKVEGSSSQWKAILPSSQIMGSQDDIGCRVCGDKMSYYQMSSSCTFGWGGIIVIVGFFITLIAGCVGRSVHPRSYNANISARKNKVHPEQRPPPNSF